MNVIFIGKFVKKLENPLCLGGEVSLLPGRQLGVGGGGRGGLGRKDS